MSLCFRFVTLLLVLNLCNFSSIANDFVDEWNDYKELDAANKEFYYYADDQEDECADAVKTDAASDMTDTESIDDTIPQEESDGNEAASSAGLSKHDVEQVSALDDANKLSLVDMMAVPGDTLGGFYTTGFQITPIMQDSGPEIVADDTENRQFGNVYLMDHSQDTSDNLANGDFLVPNKQEILEYVDDEVSNMQDGESGAVNGVIEDLEAADVRLKGSNENGNRLGSRRETADADEHLKEDTSSLLGMPRCADQAETIASAVRSTHDTVDHVENLIRSMRRHAIGMLKDMSELETDFLGSMDSKEALCSTNTNGGNENADSCGKSKAFSSDVDKKAMNNIKNPGANRNYQSALDTTSKDVAARDSVNHADSLESSTTESDKNKGNSNRIDLNGDTLLVTNEWSVPVVSVDLPQAGDEFMRHAQATIQSWKDQIEQCKLVLDAAVAHAQIAELQKALRDQAQVAPEAPDAVKQNYGSHAERSAYSASGPAAAPPAAASLSPNNARYLGWHWSDKDKSKDDEKKHHQRKADDKVDKDKSKDEKKKDEKKVTKKKAKRKRRKKKVKHRAGGQKRGKKDILWEYDS